MDLKFGIRFNEMNACFYRRLDFIFGFVGLFAGSGAFLAAIGEYRTLGIVTGALVAAVAVIERLAQPIEHAIGHAALKERYAEVLSRTDEMELPAIERELRLLQAKSPTGLSALSVPAYNANVLSNGRSDYVMPTNLWQRFVALLA
ncbi:hypothetical protein BTM36_22175 [Herbaspirillum sp. VT-16-41]|nr:hypothetical protein BTM36_22175 [Herbaspirillum sp. VT-16-41]